MNELEQIVFEEGKNKEINNLTWDEITDKINKQTGYLYSETTYRKMYKKLSSLGDSLLNLQKEKIKLSDERTQLNAYVRRIAREETLKEIASNAIKEISNKKSFLSPEIITYPDNNSVLEGILVISDWHYGIECDNAWNKYNPEIARKRVSSLRDQTIKYCRRYNIKKLHLVNLADLIAGRIHLTLRLESRIDVITQTMEVCEILAEFIHDLITSLNVDIEYYECTDNHSRLEPNKSDSLDLETLSRLTSWYLKARLNDIENKIHFNKNEFGDDIISFKIFNWNIAGVHGDKDMPQKVIDNISMMTRNSYDLMLTAHLHHFSGDEKNKCIIVSNGSLMGTDTFAKNLRLSSTPSQNLIIVSPENVIEGLHRLIVD